jgi:putative ABC transport system permease protein
MLTGAVGYTTGLTEYIIDRTSSSEIVTRQLEDKETDAISGLPFKTDEPAKDDSAKIEAFREFYNVLDVSKKSDVARDILLVPSEEYLRNAFDAYVQQMGREGLISRITETYRQSMGITDTAQIEDYLNGMSDEQLYELVYGSVGETMAERYRNEMDARLASLSDEQICASVDIDAVGDEIILEMYVKYISTDYSDYTYDGVLNALGYVDKNTPSEIYIYAATFSDKNRISDLVDEYNSGVSEENRIKMTDYVKLLMSSISTVINAITYVLIAFVGISLVVSSIMIGVITNISVLERIKEIGILRAIGASKGDIRRVFNAETFIIGLLSGGLGILVTLVLLLPINIILHYFTGISYLNAALPVAGALILILLSMALTIVAGLIPAHSASKKDPVVALRYE